MAVTKGVVSPYDRILDIATRREIDSVNRGYFLANLTNTLIDILKRMNLIDLNTSYIIASEGVTLEEIEERFYRELEFGTAGLRGVLGAGTNRMNTYTVCQATQGLADYLNNKGEGGSVAIGYDSRIKSDVFAREAAGGEIAFFGGSFTMIERGYMISLLEAAYEYVEKGIFKGIRISTRPDGISEEICEILKKYGVTAVELGAQSLDDGVLELNERGHTAKQVEDAVCLLKSFGFETGLQMMTGLYGSENSDSLETAEKIVAMKPDTVRIYPTVIIKGTRLHELMLTGEFVPKGIDETVELCARIIPMFENAGIKIIRVGLHSGGGVEGDFAGGAYHPASPTS